METINEKERKILPYEKAVLTTWPEDCFLFSILSNVKYGYNWIADSNIQIVLTHDTINYYPSRKQHFFQNEFDNIPFINKYSIDRRLLYSFENDFGKIIKKAVDEGFYISGLFNRRVLTENIVSNLNHVCYIYGYDEEENVVYMNDNFFNGINSYEKISFDRVKKAFEVALSEKVTLLGNKVVNFYRLNTDMEYQLNKDKIKKGMLDYLYGTCDGENKNNEYTFFGLKAYKKLSGIIENTYNNYIDLRNLSFLRDVAKVNGIRLDTMINSELFKIDNPDLFRYIDAQIKAARVMTNLGIKYNIKSDKKILYKLSDMIKEYERVEKIFSEYIIGLCR